MPILAPAPCDYCDSPALTIARVDDANGHHVDDAPVCFEHARNV